jgi:TATA-box binding protein (TBP) (component of TFIID and TFIIIB)
MYANGSVGRQSRMAIVNVVSSVVFDCSFDLTHILKNFKGDVDTPYSFNAVNIRQNGKSFCQIYPNGKCIVNGGKSVAESESLISFYQQSLHGLGYSAKILKSQVVNIVAVHDHGKSIRLYDVAKNNRLFFEPEIFPAIKVRLSDHAVTIHIFHTGKCTILGAKAEQDVEKSVLYLQQLLAPKAGFKKSSKIRL